MSGSDVFYVTSPLTPAQEAARALAQWIRQNPDPDNEGGLKTSWDDPGVVVVYWRGTPPAGLRKLAARQPVPVIFFQAAYSCQELVAIVKSLLSDNPDVLSSGGPSPDYSGVGVTLWTKAPATALDELRAACPVPIEFRGFVDPVPLGAH